MLRFRLRDSLSLSAADRTRALDRLSSRLTQDGELILNCGIHRDQARNRQALLERFASVLRAALVLPRVRRRTSPSAAAVERRLVAKRVRGARKRERATLE